MSKTGIVGTACLGCLLAATLASGEARAALDPYESAKITARTEIWKAINNGKCASGTAAILVDGKFVYSEGFGMADREKSLPVDRATLFNTGSIGKVYVATAVMLLVDDGRVSLDRPVTEYLQDFRMADPRYRKITVRMLLNHTSGIAGTQAWNTFGFRYVDGVKAETLKLMARAHLKHDPGAMAVYCNDGFTLAELIVERVSGQRYIDFLRERLFKPLGLKETGLGVGERKGEPVALFYESRTGKRHPPETLSILGAGGLSSTAEELCRFFAEAFSPEGRLLTKASLAEMRKAQPSAFEGKLKSPSLSIGLGWDFVGLPRYDAAGVQVLGKTGGTGNYSSMVVTVPDRGITIGVITAGSQGNAPKMALDVLDAVLIEQKIVPKEEKPVPVPPVPQKWPPEEASFGGYYASPAALAQVVFDADKDSVTLYQFKGQEKAPALTVVYQNGYYYDAEGGRYYFARIGQETYLVNTGMPGIDVIIMQGVKPLEKPQSLKTGMDGVLWLRRNAPASDGVMLLDSHFVKSWLYKDLPGYVAFNGLKRIESPEFAGMPFDALRDQSELTLFEKNGATWAWVSDLLYSPAQGTAALKPGENAVRIGTEGYSEWRLVPEGMVLGFAKPQEGRILLFSAEDTTLYDSALDTGEVYAPPGSYLESAGDTGALFTIKARPAQPAPEQKK